MLPITDTRPISPGPADERPVLVMSHSFGFARREWIEVCGLLAEDYRTITIDLPGFGAAHTATGFDMAQIARGFAEVVTELRLDRYVLVGHSMSGKIMQILASRMGVELGLKAPPAKKSVARTCARCFLPRRKTVGMPRSMWRPTPAEVCRRPSKNERWTIT